MIFNLDIQLFKLIHKDFTVSLGEMFDFKLV